MRNLPPVRMKTGTVFGTNADGTVTITLEGRSLNARKVASYTPAVNDAVLVTVRGQSAYIVGKLGVTLTDPVAASGIQLPGDRNPQTTGGILVARPVFTGSYHVKGGPWWTRDLWQGQQGGAGNYAMFNPGPNHLIWNAAFSTATLTAKLFLRRLPGGTDGPQQPTPVLFDPGPPTTSTDPHTGTPAWGTWAPGQARWVDLPRDWLASLFAYGYSLGFYTDTGPTIGFEGHTAVMTLTYSGVP